MTPETIELLNNVYEDVCEKYIYGVSGDDLEKASKEAMDELLIRSNYILEYMV